MAFSQIFRHEGGEEAVGGRGTVYMILLCLGGSRRWEMEKLSFEVAGIGSRYSGLFRTSV